MFREPGQMEEMHEAHFYHEEPLPTQVNSPLTYEKGGLHLNLHTEIHQNPRLGQIRRNNVPTEIHSPDFGILKLASPDLEKMLLAFQSGTNESPSSAHVPVNAITSEQVGFAKGLPEVLQELHDRQENTETMKSIIPQIHTSYVEETASSTDQLYLTTDANGVITVASGREKYPNTQNFCPVSSENNTDKQLGQTYVLPSYPTNALLPNTTGQLYTTPLRHPTEDHDAVNQLRALTAYNNVLATNSAFPSQVFKLDDSAIFGGNSTLQPIDLEMQEMVKRERKKQRNRVASSKCRKRKLEKEAVLESTVKDLRSRNVELSTLANALKQQICDLKQKVMDHVTEGCPITLHNVEDPDDLYNEEDWGTFTE
ncbi:transcription factor AP-1-like [Dendronephthya gigantea]|uniref:transcription factor AP-1-like n=1 Tax=Dendronephthya gigantea TaxID=151771 RepID=UPI00106DA64C|nr:transcription factor AP-1-like [Dendronephthya gigantea]